MNDEYFKVKSQSSTPENKYLYNNSLHSPTRFL